MSRVVMRAMLQAALPISSRPHVRPRHPCPLARSRGQLVLPAGERKRARLGWSVAVFVQGQSAQALFGGIAYGAFRDDAHPDMFRHSRGVFLKHSNGWQPGAEFRALTCAELTPDRTDPDSSPCSTPPRSRARTPARNRCSHRPRPGRAAGNWNRPRDRPRSLST